jgi:hypothetical protein
MDSEAYDLGWSHGYDDQMSDCPYSEGTDEYKEYHEGYEQGSNDC